MKYKVGDKVIIKSREWFDSQPKNSNGSIDFNYIVFNKQMSAYCGQSHIIEKIIKSHRGNDECYKLNNNTWDWSDHMLEDLRMTRKNKLNKLKKCQK